jgi:hypothetical protein
MAKSSGWHGLEGMRIRCGDHYAEIKDGRCGECGKLVISFTLEEPTTLPGAP